MEHPKITTIPDRLVKIVSQMSR